MVSLTGVASAAARARLTGGKRRVEEGSHSQHRLAKSLRVAVEHAASLAEGVDDVQRGDCRALGVLSVGDGVTDDALDEALQDAADLLIHDAGDALDTASAGEAADRWLSDAADVVLEGSLLAADAFCVTGFLTLGHWNNLYGSIERST